MSNGDEQELCGSGWLSSWLQTAKEKSSAAFNVVKHDLAEFTSTIQDDGLRMASNVKDKLTQENATAATEKVKAGVSSFLGGISKALVVEPDDDYQLARIVGGEAVVFDRYKARLRAIQVDPTTYTSEPTAAEAYQEWLATFDIETVKGSVSELLVSNVEVRALYTQLVPLSVSNIDFWSRYYFHCHQLDLEEARRVELMKRADKVQGEKEIGWDEDDDDEWTDIQPTSDQKPTSVASDSLPSATTTNSAPVTDPQPQVNASTVMSSAQNNQSSDSSSAAPPEMDIIHPTIDSHTNHSEQPAPVANIESAGQTGAAMSDNVSSSLEAAPVVSTDQDSNGSSTSTENTRSDSLVVVTLTPERSSPSDEMSNAKESLDEDWEKDFDVEVSEQELQEAKERLKNASLAAESSTVGDDKSEDWEDW